MDNIWFRTTFPKEPGMLKQAIIMWHMPGGTWVIHNEFTHEDDRTSRANGEYRMEFEDALEIYQKRVVRQLNRFVHKEFRQRCVDEGAANGLS